MLKGKTVLLGVTGSIAAYKIAYLAVFKETARRCSCINDEKCYEFYQSDYF